MDNGPEFVGKALDAWAHEHGVKLQFIRPGKPVENAHIESFNGRLRACVSLDDARKRIEAWRTDYNSVRPHSALGNWRRTNSGNCINRKPASPLNYEWCTQRGKVTPSRTVSSVWSARYQGEDKSGARRHCGYYQQNEAHYRDERMYDHNAFWQRSMFPVIAQIHENAACGSHDKEQNGCYSQT